MREAPRPKPLGLDPYDVIFMNKSLKEDGGCPRPCQEGFPNLKALLV